MEVISEYKGGHLRLRLTGELDHHTAREGWNGIESALDRYLPRSCALDLSALSFMDSSGIAVIFRLRNRTRETGVRFWLADPAPQCARVLAASGIERFGSIRKGEKEK